MIDAQNDQNLRTNRIHKFQAIKLLKFHNPLKINLQMVED